MKKISLLLITLCLLLINAWADQANGIVYVVPGGTGTGTSWTDALGDINAAVTEAKRVSSTTPKDVWVKAGEYTLTAPIAMANKVNVYGGFAGTETDPSQRSLVANGKPWNFTNETILKGSNSRIVHSSGNFASPTVIDGFTMTDGNGNDAGANVLNGNGGAAVVRVNMIIQNCVVKNSSVTNGAGGGINMTGGTISNCWIYNNSQSTNGNGGGGIYSAPGSGTITIENCVIESNTSTIRGGGVSTAGAGTTVCKNLTIMNNKVENNTTTITAGGAVFTNTATNSFTNCLIYNNFGINTNSNTNAVYIQGSLVNSTIVNNVGGVYYAGTATINCINNIVWGCVTTAGGTTATSISGAANANLTCENNATYNPIPSDKSWITAENIQFSSNNDNNNGPKFIIPTTFKGATSVDTEIAELRSANWNLKYDSPCLNMGLTVAGVTTDIVGNSRPAGYPQAEAKFDIGAYELPYYNVSWNANAASDGSILDNASQPVNLSDVVSYPSGISLSYTLTPATGYVVDRAYYETNIAGEEVNLIKGENNVWTTAAITSPITIYVTWKLSTSINKDIATSSFQILVVDKKVEVKGLNQGENIYVYNVMGQLIYKTVADTDSISVPLNAGCYVIKAGNETAKIVIR